MVVYLQQMKADPEQTSADLVYIEELTCRPQNTCSAPGANLPHMTADLKEKIL
jgi:hypothetical protein